MKRERIQKKETAGVSTSLQDAWTNPFPKKETVG